MEMDIVGVCVCVCVCVRMCPNLFPDDLIPCINHFDTLFCCQNLSHGPLDTLLWFNSLQSLQSPRKESRKSHGFIPILETEK